LEPTIELLLPEIDCFEDFVCGTNFNRAMNACKSDGNKTGCFPAKISGKNSLFFLVNFVFCEKNAQKQQIFSP
jgi:hypothetical protein